MHEKGRVVVFVDEVANVMDDSWLVPHYEYALKRGTMVISVTARPEVVAWDVFSGSRWMVIFHLASRAARRKVLEYLPKLVKETDISALAPNECLYWERGWHQADRYTV